MIEKDSSNLNQQIDNFLLLDPIIFEIPNSDESLQKIIDQFHIVTEKLKAFPIIQNETEQGAYYKYRFEDSMEPNIEIIIYTPAPGQTNGINAENTKSEVLFKWPSPEGSHVDIKPLENEEDKGEYLKTLQLVVAKGLQEN
jgi:hypothetical protein